MSVIGETALLSPKTHLKIRKWGDLQYTILKGECLILDKYAEKLRETHKQLKELSDKIGAFNGSYEMAVKLRNDYIALQRKLKRLRYLHKRYRTKAKKFKLSNRWKRFC